MLSKIFRSLVSIFLPITPRTNILSIVRQMLTSVASENRDDSGPSRRECRCSLPSPVYCQYVSPCDKVIHSSPVLILIALTDASNYCRIIRKRLKMAGLCAIGKVRGVQGEQEGREDCPLQGSSVADHCLTQCCRRTYCGLSSGNPQSRILGGHPSALLSAFHIVELGEWC